MRSYERGMFSLKLTLTGFTYIVELLSGRGAGLYDILFKRKIYKTPEVPEFTPYIVRAMIENTNTHYKKTHIQCIWNA